MHCAKEKKTNVKRSVYIRPLTKETYDFLICLAKNDGNCEIVVKERKPFQRNATEILEKKAIWGRFCFR